MVGRPSCRLRRNTAKAQLGQIKPYSNIATLITLPNPTWEDRQCHALKIAAQGGDNRVGVYFLGGVHAREWGSPDILINFIERIERAYLNGTALIFGDKTFSAAEIRTIIDIPMVVSPHPLIRPNSEFILQWIDVRSNS
jgi:hypothetical protein